jgi:hypothetical protein
MAICIFAWDASLNYKPLNTSLTLLSELRSLYMFAAIFGLLVILDAIMVFIGVRFFPKFPSGHANFIIVFNAIVALLFLYLIGMGVCSAFNRPITTLSP